MEGEIERRMARNESLFREVNEAIASGQWPGEEDAPIGFRCECARLGCNDLVELAPREYERIRSHPRRFVLAVGHEFSNGERVVETHSGYVVVEKQGEAGRLAEASDPRD
jgi:hypothetical protein